MKPYLFFLPLVAARACGTTSHTSCATNTEPLVHVKLFYNRKKGITPEEFDRYWAYQHAPKALDFHLRLGVVKYSQYHSTPEWRDQAKGQFPILEFDGAAEFWMHNLTTLVEMVTDPEYLSKIQPDEKNFIDGDSMKMVIGVDYNVVENGKAVQHGRQF